MAWIDQSLSLLICCPSRHWAIWRRDRASTAEPAPSLDGARVAAAALLAHGRGEAAIAAVRVEVSLTARLCRSLAAAAIMGHVGIEAAVALLLLCEPRLAARVAHVAAPNLMGLALARPSCPVQLPTVVRRRALAAARALILGQGPVLLDDAPGYRRVARVHERKVALRGAALGDLGSAARLAVAAMALGPCRSRVVRWASAKFALLDAALFGKLPRRAHRTRRRWVCATGCRIWRRSRARDAVAKLALARAGASRKLPRWAGGAQATPSRGELPGWALRAVLLRARGAGGRGGFASGALAVFAVRLAALLGELPGLALRARGVDRVPAGHLGVLSRWALRAGSQPGHTGVLPRRARIARGRAFGEGVFAHLALCALALALDLRERAPGADDTGHSTAGGERSDGAALACSTRRHGVGGARCRAIRALAVPARRLGRWGPLTRRTRFAGTECAPAARGALVGAQATAEEATSSGGGAGDHEGEHSATRLPTWLHRAIEHKQLEGRKNSFSSECLYSRDRERTSFRRRTLKLGLKLAMKVSPRFDSNTRHCGSLAGVGSFARPVSFFMCWSRSTKDTRAF